MRIALAADELTAVAEALPEELRRRGHDANVLALSLRLTSPAQLTEILDAWFAAGPSDDATDVENVIHLADIEQASAT